MGNGEAGCVDTGGRRAEEELLAGLESLNETPYAAILRPVDEVDLVDLVDKDGGDVDGKIAERDLARERAKRILELMRRNDMYPNDDFGLPMLPVTDNEVFAVFEHYPMYECAVLNAMYSYFRNDLSFASGTAFMMALNLGKAVFTIKRVVK
jgi:hypothetical protein